MQSIKRFSIRTLVDRMVNPAPKRKSQCVYLCHVSQLVKDFTGSGDSYTNNYWECNKLHKRISKRHCMNCTMYKPCNNG
jgi:hypothetical protein